MCFALSLIISSFRGAHLTRFMLMIVAKSLFYDYYQGSTFF